MALTSITGIMGKPLTRGRAWAAVVVAIIADASQFFLGPFGWAFLDQAIDVMVMCMVTWLVGFHPLFLPTFVLELIPGIDMIPTWTGCVTVVVAMRRRQAAPQTPAPTAQQDVIDI